MATNKRGIFALIDVRERQNANVWSTKSDVWLSPSPYYQLGGTPFGYFGGGRLQFTTALSTLDRIDYTNDTTTAVLRGSLADFISALSATNNNSYGWFGGGFNGSSNISTVKRIDYSSDISGASPRGPLSAARRYLAATGNSSYGWFGGGGSPIRTTVDRIDYSNDTATASPRGPLPLGATRYRYSATGNSSYGYFGGGGFPGLFSTVDRIDYSNDSATALTRGSLSLARRESAATGNSSYGWFGGGYTPATSIVDRIDYSNDTTTAPVRGQLTTPARYLLAATGNSSYGWFGGGAPGSRSTIDRIDYSNDLTTASTRGSLSEGRFALAANSPTANGLPAFQFVPAPASPARNFKTGTPGTNPLPVNTPQQVLPPGGPNTGYFAGRYPAGSIVDRIDFSNDTGIASPRGPLSVNRSSPGGVSNSSYGYIGGGIDSLSERLSSIDRIDYANDTATATPKGLLNRGLYNMGSVGNISFGWFAGGSTPSNSYNFSLVDRIDYANDTATASPRGPLSAGRYKLGATGNSSYGWFGGGYIGFPTYVSTSVVDRINYSNDVATASPRGPLSVAKQGLAATGNSSYGWFGGGLTSFPIYLSSVDRIDYSNDTATSSPKGPLNVSRFALVATGNNSYGWFGGGRTPANTSVVDRIDYSNDTATASPKGPLSSARYGLAATSARANGLPN